MLAAAEKAADALAAAGTPVTVWDVRSCVPLDDAMIADAAAHHLVVTCEDGVREGGIGMMIADRVSAVAAATDATVQVRVLGLPTRFIPCGEAGGDPRPVRAERRRHRCRGA
jgi:1-deoxy-D-xylulose-5-phosphate synthase